MGISLLEHLRLQPLHHRLVDLLVSRPDILQEDRLALFVCSERLFFHIDIDLACHRKGDDERRRHQESLP